LSLVVTLLVLGIVLALEALLGRMVPGGRGYVDLMLLPVIWYALNRSQRSALLVGCAGGLLQDAWFQTGVFGMGGFRKTLLGWALGGLAARLDLNHPPGRFLVGATLSMTDQLLEVGLYRLLDLRTAPFGPWQLLLRAMAVGLLAAVVFPIVDRGTGRDSMGRPVGRGSRS